MFWWGSWCKFLLIRHSMMPPPLCNCCEPLAWCSAQSLSPSVRGKAQIQRQFPRVVSVAGYWWIYPWMLMRRRVASWMLPDPCRVDQQMYTKWQKQSTKSDSKESSIDPRHLDPALGPHPPSFGSRCSSNQTSTFTNKKEIGTFWFQILWNYSDWIWQSSKIQNMTEHMMTDRRMMRCLGFECFVIAFHVLYYL